MNIICNFALYMIDRVTIDKVMDTANIIEVVSEFVTLKKRGVNYVGLCPFHDDKTPSFYVSPAKNLCKCFACGKGGNPAHFIMEHEQLSFPEAIRWLANKYHIEIEEKNVTAEEIANRNLRESIFIVNEFARDYFENILYNHIDGKSIGMAYFHQRGIRDDIIKKFQLGYSTLKSDAFAKEANQKGYKKEYLVKSGLCYEKEDGSLRDRFWGRVIYPWHNVTGKVVAFSGRVLQSNAKVSKYVNSPESEIYLKRRELYGIYFAKQAIIKQDKCFLVEGQMDVISMHQSGIENVVASSGTSLTTEQIKLIHRFTANVTLLYDGDAAGIHASMRGIDMLLSEGMNVKIVLLPNGEDPDSFAQKHNATEFQQYISEHEEDFIRFKARLLLENAKNDPIKRAQLVTDIAQSIGQIPNRIIRFTYTQECANILNVNEKIILEESEKYVKRRQEVFLERHLKEKEEKNVQQKHGQITSSPSIHEDSIRVNEISNNNAQEAISSLPIDREKQPLLIPSTEYNKVYQTHIPETDINKLSFYAKEQELIKLIVRYGELPLCSVETEDKKQKRVSVIEYIAFDLKQDELQFHNPFHRRILSEGMAHLHDIGFTCEHYFLTHPDQELSQMAANFISERYELSRRYEMEPEKKRLLYIITQLLVSFKISTIQEEMKHLLMELTPETLKDKNITKKIMARQQELSQTLKTIVKRTGRVVMH